MWSNVPFNEVPSYINTAQLVPETLKIARDFLLIKNLISLYWFARKKKKNAYERGQSSFVFEKY